MLTISSWRMAAIVFVGLSGFAVSVLLPAHASAHCTWRHPHHCVEEAARAARDEARRVAERAAAEARRAAERAEAEAQRAA